MKKLEMLGKKLSKIRELSGYSRLRFSTRLDAIFWTITDGKTKYGGRRENSGFSHVQIKRYEKGESLIRNKKTIAEVYSAYCDVKEKKSQITPALILNDAKSESFIEKVWKGVPTEGDFLDFENSIRLLNIPIEDDVEFQDQESEFFRLTGPEYADFINGYVYCDDFRIKNFLKLLKEKKILLFQSEKPASGKSVLARTIAFYKFNNGLQTHFFQVSSEYSKSDLSRIISQIIELGNIHSEFLLIIEDAHLNPVFVNDLLKRRDHFSSEILITSRGIPRISKRDGANIFKELHSNKISASTKLIKSIINIYYNRNFSDSQIEKTDLETILEGICSQELWGGSVNLWILSYAFRAIKSKEGNFELGISKKDIVDEVEIDLLDIANGESFRVRLLIAISVLSRFEMFTNSQFLIEQFHYKDPDILKDSLNSLYSEGLITRSNSNKNLYKIHHSSLAELYFLFTKDDHRGWWDDIYSDEMTFIIRYIVSKNNKHGFEVLFRLGYLLKNEKNFLNSLFVNKIFAQKVSSLNDLDQMHNVFILAKYSSHQANITFISNLDIKLIASNILLSNDLSIIGQTIHSFIDAFSEHSDCFWSLLLEKELIQLLDYSSEFMQIAKCISDLNQCGDKIRSDLWAKIDQIQLAKKINSETEPQEVCRALKCLFDNNANDQSQFWGEFNQITLAHKINNIDEIQILNSCFLDIGTLSYEATKSFWDEIDLEHIRKKIFAENSKYDDVENLLAILSRGAKYVFCKIYDLKMSEIIASNFNSKIQHTNLFIWVMSLNNFFSGFDFQIRYDVWKNINKDIFTQQLWATSLSDISFIIESLYNMPIKIREDIWSMVTSNPQNTLHDSFKRDNLENLVSFSKNLNEFLPLAEHEMWNYLENEEILAKIHSSKDLGLIIQCFKSLSSLSNDRIEAILEGLQNEKILEIMDSSDEKDKETFFDQLYDCHNKFIRYFWNNFNRNLFKTQIFLDTTHLMIIHDEVFELVDKTERGEKNWEKIEIDILSEKINKNPNPFHTIKCLYHIFRISFDTGLKIWKFLEDKPIFIDHISNISDLSDILAIVETYHITFEESAIEIWKVINKKRLAKCINSNDDYYKILHCLFRVASASADSIINLWGEIDKNCLSIKIGMIDSTLGFCQRLNRIFIASETVGYQLLALYGNIKLNQLSMKINASMNEKSPSDIANELYEQLYKTILNHVEIAIKVEKLQDK